jgi:hypothetical protein
MSKPRALTEKRIEWDRGDIGDFLVNPSGPELVGFLSRIKRSFGGGIYPGEARGYQSGDGDVYVWNAFSGTHFRGRSDLIDAGQVPNGDWQNQNAAFLFFSDSPQTQTESDWAQYLEQFGPIYVAKTYRGQRSPGVRGRSPQLNRLLASLKRMPVTALSEAQIVPSRAVRGLEYRVDPSARDLFGMMQRAIQTRQSDFGDIRALVGADKHVYAWDGYEFTHDDAYLDLIRAGAELGKPDQVSAIHLILVPSTYRGQVERNPPGTRLGSILRGSAYTLRHARINIAEIPSEAWSNTFMGLQRMARAEERRVQNDVWGHAYTQENPDLAQTFAGIGEGLDEAARAIHLTPRAQNRATASQLPVLINPSPNEFAALISKLKYPRARMLGRESILYVWEAGLATHDSVADSLQWPLDGNTHTATVILNSNTAMVGYFASQVPLDAPEQARTMQIRADHQWYASSPALARMLRGYQIDYDTREHVMEASMAKPIIVYHGTSGRLARDILKQGMLANPKQRTWAEDPHVSVNMASRVSLPGSYWTTNFATARSAVSKANEANRKSPEEDWRDIPGLIVIAQIIPQSAVADEDSLNGPLGWAWTQMMKEVLGVNSDAVQSLAAALWYPHGSVRGLPEKLLAKFTEVFHAAAKTNDRQPVPADLIKRTFHAETNRLLAHTEAQRGTGFYDVFRDLREFMPAIPSVPEAEHELLACKDALTRYYRKSTKEVGFSHTLRIDRDVGFSGPNRIIGLVQYSIMDRTPLVLLYGMIPEDFIRQYTERVGAWPGVIRPDGLPIDIGPQD